MSAIVTTALDADYWKPVQAGTEGETDTASMEKFIPENAQAFPEAYQLQMAASPHIAARAEGIHIDIGTICSRQPHSSRPLVIEGAGGLMVPLNEKEFVIDLIKALQCTVILVSRNYLGSINHSLLTARVCKEAGLNVGGWIFNDRYLDYEEQIARWSGYPRIASIPHAEVINKAFIYNQAALLKETFLQFLC